MRDTASDYLFPLPVTVVVATASTAFSAVFAAFVSPVDPPWSMLVLSSYIVTGLSWGGLFNAIGTRLAFRGCVLHL